MSVASPVRCVDDEEMHCCTLHSWKSTTHEHAQLSSIVVQGASRRSRSWTATWRSCVCGTASCQR